MSIVIVGMLDERKEALKLIKEQIEKRGHKTVLIDISIGKSLYSRPCPFEIIGATLDWLPS